MSHKCFDHLLLEQRLETVIEETFKSTTWLAKCRKCGRKYEVTSTFTLAPREDE